MPKCCSKCGENKPVEAFNRDRTRPDGIYPQCKACSRASCRKVYQKHHERHVEMKRAWKDANRDRHNAINSAYRKADPARTAGYTAAYRAALKQATPPWQDPKFLDLVKEMCPPGYHVDHIHPLRGETVCGLNVPWNVQYLPAEEHRKKGRKLVLEAGG